MLEPLYNRELYRKVDFDFELKPLFPSLSDRQTDSGS